jgi:hypothetical protein
LVVFEKAQHNGPNAYRLKQIQYGNPFRAQAKSGSHDLGFGRAVADSRLLLGNPQNWELRFVASNVQVDT